jgi:hypothetical protein
MPPKTPPGNYQVRVLIPKIASAAIIGRKGCVIQRMGEISNCKLQLGEDNDPYNTRERILVINSTVIESLVVVSLLLLLLFSTFLIDFSMFVGCSNVSRRTPR